MPLEVISKYGEARAHNEMQVKTERIIFETVDFQELYSVFATLGPGEDAGRRVFSFMVNVEKLEVG